MPLSQGGLIDRATVANYTDLHHLTWSVSYEMAAHSHLHAGAALRQRAGLSPLRIYRQP
ncbi:hypothetical protein AERO9A_190113 [Aeromonas salmonicida]|nr:hypothetical protein AERO9A_190113 [Aeromonas salmonicida]